MKTANRKLEYPEWKGWISWGHAPDQTSKGGGKYDASTNTFEFCVAYIVSAGSFGWGVETFKLDGAVEFASTSGKAVKSRSAYPVRLGNFSRNLPHAGAALVKKASSPALAGIRAEHEAAAAKFSAREIPSGSVKKVVKGFTKVSANLGR